MNLKSLLYFLSRQGGLSNQIDPKARPGKRLGVVKELAAQKRNRLFSYAGYVEIMRRGTELPGR